MARTETLTVMFTDIVGSTELAARLGHDRYEELRRAHFEAMRWVLAEHAGDEVKSTGDGLMLRFASAADAVSCAVAMQQTALAETAASEGMEIRVGLSTGEVTRDQGDLYGTAVVEAARLCAAAAPGQILAAEIVRTLAHGRGPRFAPIATLALRGFPEPVAAHEVEWEPRIDAATPVPWPPGLTADFPVDMFGRRAEQERISRSWQAAASGQRRLVLIGGEPGIGKTRLACEAARAAHAAGGVVLFGACDEDVALPYRALIEALRHGVAHAGDAVLTAHVREHRGELARLLPEIEKRVDALPKPQMAEPETERSLLFEAVTGWLSVASRHAPIMLVLDDLQWAGMPELLLLKHVMRSSRPLRLLVVATYRASDLSRTHPLTTVLADLWRQPGVERLTLEGIDRQAVTELVGAAGYELDAAGVALADALHDETEGSPLFITEILRSWAESGVASAPDGGARFVVPESIRAAIHRRLQRLSEPTNQVLTLASVLGRQFDVPLLARLADIDDDAVVAALEEAAAAALVEEVPEEADRFRFTHALIRTALYEEPSASRRARLHRKAGEALEALTASAPEARVDELAYHWLQAASVAGAAKAVHHAALAAQKAIRGLAFEVAAEHYEHALAVLAPGDRATEELRCDLLLGLADARKRAGAGTYRQSTSAAAEAARRLRDPVRLARAALAQSRPGGFLASAARVDEDTIRLYEEAAAALAGGDDVLRAQVLAQLAGELTYTRERERRHALAREAIAIGRRLDDPRQVYQILSTALFALSDPFTLAERLQSSAELQAVAQQVGDLELLCEAALHRSLALLESGEIDGAVQAIESIAELAARLRQPYYAWLAAIGRSMLSIMRGNADAEEKARDALEVGRRGGQPDAELAYFAQMAEIRYIQGRDAESAPTQESAMASVPHIAAWRAGLAHLYAEIGRPDDARKEIAQLAANGFDLPIDGTWGNAVCSLAEACSLLRDEGTARALYPRVLPVAGQANVLASMVTCTGSFASIAGLLAACLGRWSEAERHFEDALAMNARLGARPYGVRVRRAYASMLIERGADGDRARASEHVATALADAEELGMAREIARLRALRELEGGA